MGNVDKFVPRYTAVFIQVPRYVPRDNVNDTYALCNACCHTLWPNSIHYCYTSKSSVIFVSIKRSKLDSKVY